jgi:hypothetical protein
MVLDFNKLEINLTGNSALSNVSLRCNPEIKSFNFNLLEVLLHFHFILGTYKRNSALGKRGL